MDNETYTSLFYLKHSPMQCTWEMPRFLGHKAKQLISSANDLQRLTALYVSKCNKLGIWLNMPLFLSHGTKQPINANDLKDTSLFKP